MKKFKHLFLRLLGLHVEWEVQCTDHQGCYRTWTSGFETEEQALDSMRKSIEGGARWAKSLDSEWRVEETLSSSRYIYNVKQS